MYDQQSPNIFELTLLAAQKAREIKKERLRVERSWGKKKYRMKVMEQAIELVNAEYNID